MRAPDAIRAGLAVAALIGVSASHPVTGRAAEWVFFRDRGPAGSAGTAAATSSSSSDLPMPGLSPNARALARRAKARAERIARHEVAGPIAAVDDAPPAADYLDALRAAGARIRVVSRWMNAASVEADPAAMAVIRALPFVSETRPVARFERDQIEPEPVAAAIAAAADSISSGVPATAFPADGGDVADMGPSYAQLAAIGIPEAHALGFHGEGVVIGVLDSGFSLKHEALRHLDVLAVRDFVQGDDDTEDDRGRTPPDPPGQQNHGTQVLSLIGAYRPGEMIGAAYRARFLLAKTERTDVEVPAEEDIWAAGIEWAEAMGADVITTSLSYTRWYKTEQLDGRTAVPTRMANLAWERGVLLLNSAGNEGPTPGTIGTPGDAAGEITVGSVDLRGAIVGFSSRGPTGDGRVKPDVVAPGTGILVVQGGARDGYLRGGGTSYSTPLTAGLAALVLEAHPDWGPEAVREAIVMSASRADRPDNDYGWGVVNARAAILYPRIEGRIRDATTGAPIAGARIAWERTGGSRGDWAAPGDAPPTGAVSADAGGDYTIGNLPPGLYTLRIDADGYAPATVGPFDVPPNLDGADVSLDPAASR